MQIHVHYLGAERMMLDFLHQRQALGAGVVIHRQVHQHVFRDGMMQQVGDFLEIHLQILGRGLAAINGRGHTSAPAEFRHFGALHLRTRIRFQCYRFHFIKIVLATLNWCVRL